MSGVDGWLCDGFMMILMRGVRWCFVFFFQAEDGIRDAQESRGLGDVYKRQRKYFYKIKKFI
ncbi:hypothetical protein CDFC105_33130 [Clostridioides difficile]|nr:hypothetical protein CDFC105_33130 [Clostridioides difficile]